MVSSTGAASEDEPLPLEVQRHRKLVHRSHFITIVAAWVVTVLATALLSAAVFYILNSTITL